MNRGNTVNRNRENTSSGNIIGNREKLGMVGTERALVTVTIGTEGTLTENWER